MVISAMNAKHLGLILRVNDIDMCRLFYRDLLELGEDRKSTRLNSSH